MALDELLRTLERDATAEADAIVAEARAFAAQLDESTARARQARDAADAAHATATAQAASDGARHDADHRARTQALTARAAMLARVRAAALAALPEALARHAEALGPRLVEAARACAGDAPGELRCAPVLREHVGATALRVVEDPALTGVIIALDRGVRIDATLAAVLARAWPRLAAAALATIDRGAAP